MLRRTVPVLYWVALGMLLVGAILLLVAGDDVPQLDHAGEIVAGLAWPVAAVGAALDTIRRQRREDAHERS